MNRDQFNSHQLWDTLQEVEFKLSEIDALGDVDISTSLNDLRELRAFNVSLRETDQLFLVGAQLLDEALNAWKQVLTGLHNYIQNPQGHRQHLEYARTSYLEQVRNPLLLFPRPEESGPKKAASTRAANAYIEQIEEARGLLFDQIHALREERDELLKTHQASVAELTVSIESVRAETKDLSARIDGDENRISAALIESNEAFNKSQSDRQDRFSKWLEQQEESFLEEAQPQHENIMHASDRATEALKEVEALRTSVVDMSNLASGDILGDAYKKSALWDRVAGYLGYLLGMLAGAAGVWVVLNAFGSVQAGLSWPQVALKLGLTTGIGGIAAMAFRFGGQALTRATAFKRQELELRALTPFLQDVDGSDEAKLTFVRQAFGQAWHTETRSDKSDDAETPDLVKLLQSAVDLAAKATK